MAKVNFDEMDSEFPPIEVELEGKSYSVTTVTERMLDTVASIGKEEKNAEALGKQLAIFFNVPADTFKGIDLRKLAKVSTYVSEELSKQFNNISKPQEKKES